MRDSSPAFVGALLGLALAAQASFAHAGTCTPTSATITFQSDDVFYFWLNGNEVVNGVEAGATATSVSIPVADFSAPGADNYFAVEDADTDCCYVGVDWVIAITCSDGSVSYITDADSTFTMYDTGTGTTAPSVESGLNWYQPGWPDSTGLFNGPPVDVTSGWWYTAITDPETGAPLPVLSHSATGEEDDGNDGEVLYFRESVVLTEETPTTTPTSYPTPCGGEPAYQTGSAILQGQPGDSGGSTTTDYTYDVGNAVPDALVMVVVQNPTGGQLVSSMTFGGSPMTAGPTATNAVGGAEALYYLPVGDLAAAADTLAVTFNNTDNDNFVITLYIVGNVNQTTPIGTTAGATDVSGNGTFSPSITPAGTNSVIMDFLVGNNGCMTQGNITSSQTSTGLWDGNDSGTYTWTDYTQGGAKGVADTLNYDWTSSCGGELSWWLVEVEAPDFCGTPTETWTFTDSPTITDTDSPSATATPSKTPTATASSTATSTASSTATLTGTPTETRTSTGSPTATGTDSPSATATPSKTPTATASSTATSTASSTATLTGTPTETRTSTGSPTATGTDSPSATATPSETLTATASSTATSMASSTATLTGTPTETRTSTGSPTATGTDSPSATATPSETPTGTFTASFTATLTGTPTETATASRTPTPSPTASPEDSATPTPTATPTETASPTATPTPNITGTPTLSGTPSATSTGTGTATATLSVTATYTDSPQNTATGTSTVSRTPTPTPTGTPTGTPPATFTLSPTPSPSGTSTFTAAPSPSWTSTTTATPTGTDTPTATDTSTGTPPGTATSTSTPTPTTTGTFTVTATFTVSDTPVLEPYTATVGVYNSAGELVKTLYSGTSEYPANQAQVQQVSGADGPQVDITGLDGDAGSDLVWNENNNNGQAVAGGIYEVQIATVNNYGQVTTQDTAVSVVSTQGMDTLDVYNSAGELVANLSAQLASLTATATGMGLSGDTLVPSLTPVAENLKGNLAISVSLANGGSQTVYWNGLNTQGQPLQPGNYLLTLSAAQGGGGVLLETKTIVILGMTDGSARSMAASALVVPNPVTGGWFEVRCAPDGVDRAVGVLYTLSGQRVGEAATGVGAAELSFAGKWSSGIYLLDFEVDSPLGGVEARRVLKVAVVR